MSDGKSKAGSAIQVSFQDVDATLTNVFVEDQKRGTLSWEEDKEGRLRGWILRIYEGMDQLVSERQIAEPDDATRTRLAAADRRAARNPDPDRDLALVRRNLLVAAKRKTESVMRARYA